jgi:hypothetical protein
LAQPGWAAPGNKPASMSPKSAATFGERDFCIARKYADYAEPSATVPNTGPADGNPMIEISSEKITCKHPAPITAKPVSQQPTNAIAFTVQAACALSGLGKTKLFELMRTGTLRRIRIGGRTLIAGDSLRAMLAAEEAS